LRTLDLIRDGAAGHAVQHYVEHERVHVAAHAMLGDEL
jgi:hypothetical protein